MCMQRAVFVIVFLLTGLSGLLAAGNEIDFLFEKGNEAYFAGNYEEAIRLYETVIQHGFESGYLYYNLGSAYYKQGGTGQSILYYERAKKWLPNDENIDFNLRMANLNVKDRIDLPEEFFLFRWHRNLVNLLSSRQWGMLLALSTLLAAITFAVFWLVDKHKLRAILRIVLIVWVMLLLFSVPMTIQRHNVESRSDQGIILEPTVRCLAAPHEGSTELFIIHEGIKVSVRDTDGDWRKIELIDGKQGWVPAGSVGII